MAVLHFAMEQFIEKAWPTIFQQVLRPETKKRWSFSLQLPANKLKRNFSLLSFLSDFRETADGESLRIYELAGRVMLTFSCDDQWISYVTHDKDSFGKAFGLQGYDGKYWVHDGLIQAVNRHVVICGTDAFQYDTKQLIG